MSHRDELDVDVLVVGAGPAGAAAAARTAAAGLRTLVVDRAVFPRDKCCGDGLTTLALRELDEMGLRPNLVESWQAVAGATIRSPSGHEQVYPLPRGPGTYAAVAQRAHLDDALVALARAAGATVADGHPLRTAVLAEDGPGIRAQVDGLGVVAARWAVGADGMWSPLRRALGASPAGYRGEWHAFRQYFCNVGPRADELTVWFEADLLPGYAWSFPLPDGRANVGFGIRRGGPHAVGTMNRLWSDLLQRPHIRAVLGPDAESESSHRAWPIPARVGRMPLATGCALFAGDAAAVSDPMTGEGIGQALLTGRLAAEAIIEAGTGAAATGEATAAYRQRVRDELVADDRMSRVLTPLLARTATTRSTLRLAGATAWTRRNFARWLFEDYPRAMIATPRRWRRGAPGASGAFSAVDTSARGSARPPARTS